jgi:hypothetical protein
MSAESFCGHNSVNKAINKAEGPQTTKAANQPAAVSRTDLEHAQLRVVKALPVDKVRTLRQVALHVRQHLHPVTATTQPHFNLK